MHPCPHCSNAAISSWRKAKSSPLFPIHCPKCDGESVATGWSKTLAAVGGELLLWASVVLALAVNSLHALLLFPAGLVGLMTATNRTSPLVPFNDSFRAVRRKTARRFWITAAIVAAILVAWKIF